VETPGGRHRAGKVDESCTADHKMRLAGYVGCYCSRQQTMMTVTMILVSSSAHRAVDSAETFAVAFVVVAAEFVG
jgi:hypothetical protein